ncbi:MAG: aspartyl protease family protein [Hyphomonas sp.]
MIDTGASFCAIKPKLGRRLRLNRVDRAMVSGVSAQGTSSEGFAGSVSGFLALENPSHALRLQLVAVDFSRDHNELGLLLGRPALQTSEPLNDGDCGASS